ncbi:methylated-DNA--[protein]-cysteine S-methyltransferase [Demequina sp. TTPB684]|uniref:methylated-DNA--[protein]-cysteine S-methyltransferase n=1 Tax=unclassified Demequina TaxID=2620311 RepID=UPI001CF225C5|nr:MULTISPECIES: methylated-DNA--[protein]-cysteine S-methyltransferase [unclassified Demequina]MCB2412877.1 methylated-DNA--[protein]-cysteine S-methyltransferase [Demequina sp. TTPB684]UPU88146.1 methylated-DNA--[protein]-cysteine S-methyltransferase [Demequina sp. TMPB413]
MYCYETLDTPDGPFTIVEDPQGAVVASAWSTDVHAVAARARIAADDLGEGSCRASAAVRAYYAGDSAALDGVEIAQRGTPFQLAVWGALRKIAPGEVRRYGELAAAFGSPGASRAVGAACGRNAVALFVPCHRVVGAAGSLTGFAWGVDIKRSLLAREGVKIAG